MRKIIQDIAEEDRATHAITREDIYNRVKYFGMSYEDTVAAADLCGRIKRALASDAAEQGLLVVNLALFKDGRWSAFLCLASRPLGTCGRRKPPKE